MPIPFTCPHCGNQVDVADEYAGQTGPCAECGRQITVPEGAAVAAPPLPKHRNTPAIVALVAAAMALVGMCTFGGYSMMLSPYMATQAKEEEAKACERNMTRIMAALQSYHKDHGAFPPAFSVDGKGKPLHSWRVLILPYLGHKNLYDQLRLDLPWSDPVNRQFATQMPAEYHCPGDPQSADTTNYVVVNGKGLAFNGSQATAKGQITDGLANTILVVEAVETHINWMAPRDLQADKVSFTVNSDLNDTVSSHHLQGAHVGLADGSVKFVRDSMDSTELQSLFTISGNEPVPVW